MAKIYQSREFRTLEKIWNKRLEQSGFVDAEETIGTERSLKQNSANSYRQASKLERDTKPQYFNLIQLCWHIEKWECEIDKLIMAGVAQGLRIKEISESVIEELGPRKSERKTIRYIIRRYENRWGIKQWSAEQLTWNKIK